MPGCAVEEFEMTVSCMSNTIEGVREDVIEILLNLKGIAVLFNYRGDHSESQKALGRDSGRHRVGS